MLEQVCVHTGVVFTSCGPLSSPSPSSRDVQHNVQLEREHKLCMAQPFDDQQLILL